MKNILSSTTAANLLIGIFSAVIIFHLFVLAGLVPANIVWGGNLNDHKQIIIMESISILLNLLMLAVVCVYRGVLKITYKSSILRGIFWLMFILFVVNTLGNLNAKTSTETYIFAPITFVLAILCFQIAAFGFSSSASSTSKSS